MTRRSAATLLSALAAGIVIPLLTPICGLAAPSAAARGEALLQDKACTGCHSMDGTFKVGPTFLGLFGRQTTVVTDGKERTLTIDGAYLRRSMRSPDADVVKGFLAGSMPALQPTDAEVDDIVAALQARSGEEAIAEAAQAGGSMWSLAVAAALFVLLHLVMSSGPVRRPAIAKLGKDRFQLIYGLIVAAVLAWEIYAWTRAPFVPLWTPAPWTRWVPLLLMPAAYVLLVASLTIKSPTFAGMESSLDKGVQLDGFLGITRHPMLAGIALWGLAHIPPNGELSTLLLLGSMVLLAVLGALHIEARRRDTFGERWVAYTKQTSMVPFVAMLRGRARISWRGLGWWRIAAGLAFYGSMLWLHQLIIGTPVLP